MKRYGGSMLAEASVLVAVMTLIVLGTGRLIAAESRTLQQLISELRYQRRLTSAVSLAALESRRGDSESVARILRESFPDIPVRILEEAVFLGEDGRDQVRIWIGEDKR